MSAEIASERWSEDVHAQQLAYANQLFHAFLDWRYRIMVRFFVVVGAPAVGVRLTIQSDGPVWWHPVLLCTPGAVFSLVVLLLDRVNQHMLDLAYEHGGAIEREVMPADAPGMFQLLHARRTGKRPHCLGWRSYRRLLLWCTALRASHSVSLQSPWGSTCADWLGQPFGIG